MDRLWAAPPLSSPLSYPVARGGGAWPTHPAAELGCLAEEGSMSGAGQSRGHRLGLHIDSDWPEVLLINDYAVFMGYLSMVVTGTGFLVLTWSTVILLGGFVSMLSNKDFWSLTVITLVQTRIFDVFLNGKVSHIGYSLKRLCKAARFIALPHNHKKVGFRGAVRVLVFTIVLCPLFLLYMFGLFVSPWISLWRLIQQDYGVTAGDSSSKAHLQPALVVLYSLALFQGVLFYYRAISAWEEQKLVKDVADKYMFDTVSRSSVSDYLHEIKVGCENDPSFARGRNLITYAVKLMESTSPDGYLSGARILDTLIKFNRDDASGSELPGQSMQIYNMIGSASSSPILHNLVQMLDFKSAYDGEIRLRAARIVDHFAGEVRLDKILQGIRCVSSLLELEQKGFQNDHHSSFQEDDGDQLSFEEEDDHQISVKEKDYYPKDYKQMQLTGMQILLKLSYDKNNLFLMSNTDDPALINKIVALITSKGSLHKKQHNEWSRMAELGVKILSRFMRFMYGPTKSNNILWHEISTSSKAIGTLESILECDQCDSVLKKHAIRILKRIFMDTSSAMGEGDRERFIGSLMDMSLHNSNGDFQNLAGVDLALKKQGLSILKEIYLNPSSIMGEGDRERFIGSLMDMFLDNSKGDFGNLPGEDLDLKKQELSILKEICMDPSSFMGEGDREKFIGTLMDMFLHNSKGDLFEKLAGDDLVQICRRSGSSATIILRKYGHDIVDCIADTRSSVYSSMHRKIAAKILNHLCSPYSTDEEHIQNLKEAIIDLIPKVLREALGWGLTGEEILRVAVSGLEGTQDDDWKLQEALASLCATVFNRIVSKDADLTARFNNIAAGICDQTTKPRMTFADLINEAVKVHRIEFKKPEKPKPAARPELYEFMPAKYPPPHFMYLGEEDPNACCIS
ncbi:uncharacterized protein LOC127757206 isoform X1 [Oryza glaberrima]|uniref:Uncharacterized protein n=2 Tax=Oryza glaberrima TaxID=4538 RepID=I1R5M6_ORYGL|nr:uncharacterized protein LOC127757206 isoform X1 [Oryza glaberrima]